MVVDVLFLVWHFSFEVMCSFLMIYALQMVHDMTSYVRPTQGNPTTSCFDYNDMFYRIPFFVLIFLSQNLVPLNINTSSASV